MWSFAHGYINGIMEFIENEKCVCVVSLAFVNVDHLFPPFIYLIIVYIFKYVLNMTVPSKLVIIDFSVPYLG